VIETNEYEGYWWLPIDGSSGVPSEQSAVRCGTLTITRGECHLKVLGSFGHEVLDGSPGEMVYSPFPGDVPRILGFTTSGVEITLESCAATSPVLSFPGISTTTYRASVALVGAWFGLDEEVCFDEFAIRTSELDTWVGVSGFAPQETGWTENADGEPVLNSTVVRFNPPETIRIPLDYGEEARIAFDYRLTGMKPVPTEAGIRQRAWLFLRYAEPRRLEALAASVGQLRNFLSLAIGRPESVLAVEAYKDGFRQSDGGSRRPIKVFWEIPHNPEPRSRSMHPIEMLFRLPDARPSISAAMQAWFAKQDLFQPVLNLYFGMLYHPDIYIDVRFLAYAQALETYDFRRRDPYELPEGEHRERMRSIRESAPAEWREWLNTRLLSSNYRTLDQRVRDVLSECASVSERIVGATSTERDAFVTLFKHSRNYYTHYTPALEAKAAKGASLYLLIVQLRAIIEMSLLRELGFECAEIGAILERVRRYDEIQHFHRVVAEATSESPEPSGE
jgi:hypothetical protein